MTVQPNMLEDVIFLGKRPKTPIINKIQIRREDYITPLYCGYCHLPNPIILEDATHVFTCRSCYDKKFNEYFNKKR